jgi:hypothetical protein
MEQCRAKTPRFLWRFRCQKGSSNGDRKKWAGKRERSFTEGCVKNRTVTGVKGEEGVMKEAPLLCETGVGVLHSD